MPTSYQVSIYDGDTLVPDCSGVYDWETTEENVGYTTDVWKHQTLDYWLRTALGFTEVDGVVSCYWKITNDGGGSEILWQSQYRGNIVDPDLTTVNVGLYGSGVFASGTAEIVEADPPTPGGTNMMNSSALGLQWAQLGDKVYIADYRPVNLYGTDGTIASGNRLSDNSGTITDWTTLSIDTTLDVVWISGSVDIESNIFPITSVTAGYIVFGGTMSNQTGDAIWQIGRLPKVFDTKNPTAALGILMDELPVPRSNYNIGLVSITNGAVTMSGGDWSSVPQASDDSMLTLTVPVTEGTGTVQYLVAVGSLNAGAGTCTLNDTSSDPDRTNVSYTLEWTSDYYGLPPLNCNLICNYRGRLVLAGPGAIWYMSRVLDPNDWDYGYEPNDASRPVGGVDTDAGSVPEPITALIKHSDDYLILACERSLWLMTSDPAFGGNIHAITRDVGVLGPNAWCNLPDKSTVFMSRDGLYWLPPGGQPQLQPLSRPRLPADLLNIDFQDNLISLAYDLESRGIHVFVSPADGSTGTHYFVDWVTKSFWPVTLPDALQPLALVQHSAGPNAVQELLLGCHDGYVRKFSTSATDDDGTAIQSLVTYGPFRTGGPGYYGEIVQIAADLDESGQGADWRIFQGDSANAAIDAAVTAGYAGAAPWSGSWVAGANHRQYPGAVGAAVVVVVSGAYGWAIEGMRMERRQKGPIR